MGPATNSTGGILPHLPPCFVLCYFVTDCGLFCMQECVDLLLFADYLDSSSLVTFGAKGVARCVDSWKGRV